MAMDLKSLISLSSGQDVNSLIQESDESSIDSTLFSLRFVTYPTTVLITIRLKTAFYGVKVYNSTHRINEDLKSKDQLHSFIRGATNDAKYVVSSKADRVQCTSKLKATPSTT